MTTTAHPKRHEKKRPQKPPSSDDLWLDELHTGCAKAIARWLKSSIDLERPIKTLTLAELKRMAGAFEAEWIKMTGERLIKEKPPLTDEEKQAYAELLLGA